MATIYSICAVACGLFLLLQLAMTLMGLTGGEDMDMDFGGGEDMALDSMDSADTMDSPDGTDGAVGHQGHSSLMSEALRWLSVKGLVGGLAFFGLFGLLGQSYHLAEPVSLAMALTSGIVVQFVITFAFRSLMALRSDGAINLRNAVGCTGTVYTPIPGERKGEGKIQLTIQDRTEEFLAQTTGTALPTGTPIQVVEVLGENLMLVKPV